MQHTILDVVRSFPFSCSVPRRVMYSPNLDFRGGDVSNSGGSLSIQVCF